MRCVLMRSVVVTSLLLPWVGLRGQNPVVNGGFEEVIPAVSPATTDQGYGSWQVKGEPLLRPTGWTLNATLTGTLEVPEHGAGQGRYLRLTGDRPSRPAHVYQSAPWHQGGQWYGVTGRARGTGGSVGYYVYPPKGEVAVRAGYTLSRPLAEWTPFSFWFRSEANGTQSACLYVGADAKGKVMEVDDLAVNAVGVNAAEVAMEPITFANAVSRMVFTPAGELAEVVDLRTGSNYAGPRMPA